MIIKIAKFYLLFVLLSSCSSKYIQKVSPDTKTKFGFEISAPSVSIFFVENGTREVDDRTLYNHKNTANRLYNKYGPATDRFFIAETNARDFKFNLKGVTYYIEVDSLPQRTAMILFNGRSRPIIEFNSSKYQQKIKKFIK
ncbi:hypothetical protein ACFSX9_15345 [Flavobacterium ardleyense]|uniref:Lipoprotein n=1 Tax=Flavobacterium ardleyense TaxID=2038737 RepID=A0ABW5ZB44_9FLAO